jgi:uncharacterized membrane protein
MKFPHNLSRVEAFSDGVFAFAATLMVVNLSMETSMEFTRSSLTDFLSFAVSFFVLVGLWWVHYNFFRRADYIDNAIIGLNAVLLFVVLYYVFPLKSLVQSWMGQGVQTMEDLAQLFLMYGLGFTLIFLCFSLMYLRAYKKSKSAPVAMTLYFYARHFGIFVFSGMISVVLAYFEVGIKIGLPGFIFGILGPLCYLHSYWFEKKFDII